jgi:hypothetical protein
VSPRREREIAAPRVRFHCAACDVWICTFYVRHYDSAITTALDGRMKNARPYAEGALWLLTCPRNRCQRQHFLAGAQIADAAVRVLDAASGQPTRIARHVHLRDVVHQ